MDRRRNPFAPGAGTRPPELAGRSEIIENARVALARVGLGRAARSQMLLGLRGVGKTVLLNEIGRIAEEEGYRTIELEAPENRRLAEMLVPPLRRHACRASARRSPISAFRRSRCTDRRRTQDRPAGPAACLLWRWTAVACGARRRGEVLRGAFVRLSGRRSPETNGRRARDSRAGAE